MGNGMRIRAISFVFVLGMSIYATQAQAESIKNSREYREAYACGLRTVKEQYDESVKNGYKLDANSAVAFCVGNSYDPSRVQMQAYRDAVKAAVAARTKPSSNLACTFGYGVYQANGSRVDGFEEGLQKITTMRQLARMLPGRIFSLYDQAGRPISAEQAKQWFYVISTNKYGVTDIGLTKQALQTCSKKQLG